MNAEKSWNKADMKINSKMTKTGAAAGAVGGAGDAAMNFDAMEVGIGLLGGGLKKSDAELAKMTKEERLEYEKEQRAEDNRTAVGAGAISEAQVTMDESGGGGASATSNLFGEIAAMVSSLERALVKVSVGWIVRS